MPHLRFIRDKRGYETTALLTSGGRRRGKHQRVLYFFRTPPGVRVGRAPIDEDAIRLLEEHNPGVQFDWTRILKQPTPPHATEFRRSDDSRESRRSRDSGEGGHEGRREHQRSSAQPASGSQLPASGYQLPASSFQLSGSSFQLPAETAESAERLDPGEPEPLEPGEHEPLEPAEPEPPEAAEPEPPEAGSRQLEADSWQPEADSRELEAATCEPRYARIGAEGLARLRARYAEVMARIAEKPLDNAEAVREELKLKAERLNPDAWVTDDEVTAALEQYEAVFEELRAVVGRPPRRHRRRRV